MRPFIMPFGKYKNVPLPDIIASDPAYVEWLRTGADIRDNLKNALNNEGYEMNGALEMEALGLTKSQQADSFEHNKLQMKFLDEELCMKAYLHFDFNNVFHETRGRKSFPKATAMFEIDGVDVLIYVGFATVRPKFGIELKPKIHEDYPHILRQMQAANTRLARQRADYKVSALLTEEITTKSATREQLNAFFARAGIKLALMSEIEGYDLAERFESIQKKSAAQKEPVEEDPEEFPAYAADFSFADPSLCDLAKERARGLIKSGVLTRDALRSKFIEMRIGAVSDMNDWQLGEFLEYLGEFENENENA